MSVSLAELPLPGGQPDATLVLRPLQCGTVAMPEGWVHRAPGPSGAVRALGIGVPRRDLLRAPIVAYLIEHPAAGLVLIDTGFHAEVITDKRRALGAVNALVFRGVQLRREDTIAAQLTDRAIDPGDVGLIVMTHLHVDHASGLRDFPGATVLVCDAEWQAAQARDSSWAGYHRAHTDPSLEYRLIRFPTPPATGVGRVEQAVDLFGDGSLRLLATPGHSRGHMSVVVRLGDQDALLAGDAIYTLATLREGQRPFRAVDWRAYDESLQVLAAYDAAHPDALVIPGHDMAAWSALRPIYR